MKIFFCFSGTDFIYKYTISLCHGFFSLLISVEFYFNFFFRKIRFFPFWLAPRIVREKSHFFHIQIKQMVSRSCFFDQYGFASDFYEEYPLTEFEIVFYKNNMYCSATMIFVQKERRKSVRAIMNGK
jgi:hypothetical protein